MRFFSFHKKEKKPDKIVVINNIERVWMFKLFGQINIAHRLASNEIELLSFTSYYNQQTPWFKLVLDVECKKDDYVKTVSSIDEYMTVFVKYIEIHLSSIDDFEMC